ncbi:MAG: hypothetical protein K9J12_13700 [Melioribacteraceae bacterium]|nr:hypothetical protein [Melioribacteraceae bacterium]MCF8263182.1 hypothetical protein [Melioribacteraceae bacterium]MCF8430330.1 hypothetical protein [Melioribacteraceae bacterium]
MPPEKRVNQHLNVIEAAYESGVRKIVYTSIVGETEGMAFSPVVISNRQTEEIVKSIGMEWAIGRNGLYIEPDVEYIENYKALGKVTNCAGNGKCGYTTRDELAFAYSKLLTENEHNGNVYNLLGETITQYELTELLNKKFNLNLIYDPISIDEYKKDRKAELGEFMGNIIAGIYEGISKGFFDKTSDFSKAAGREHIGWSEYFSKE